MDPGRIKLRHLTVLLEVARTGSAKAAATFLCVTESAVSKTLKELESELQLQLFERTKRGMQLTESGRRFSNHAFNAVAALRTGMASARDAKGEDAAVLRIGAMPVIASIVLPDVLRLLKEVTPALIVEVISGSKATLLERLRKGDIELVLGRLPPPEEMSGLSFEQLFLDRYVFVVRPEHPLVGQAKVDLKQVSTFPLIMPSRDTVTWGEIQRFYMSQGIPLNADRVETIYLHLSRNYALSSDAVWSTSGRLAAADIGTGSLIRLPVDTAMLEAPLGIIARPADAVAGRTELLRRLIRKASNALPSVQ